MTENARERDSLVEQFLRPDCVSAGPLSTLAGHRESFEAFFCCQVCFALRHSSNSRSTPIGLTDTSSEPSCP